MKVNVLARDETEFTRERSQDITKVYRNPDPKQHNFQQAREYTRALNATKLDNLFAKPFLYALDGHADGVYCMARVPTALPYVVSGDGEGEVKLWHLGHRKQLWTAKAHTGRVRGIAVDPFGELAFTCAADKTIKMWDLNATDPSMSNYESNGTGENTLHVAQPINVFLGRNNFNGLDHHKAKTNFATCGVQVDLWDHNRADPIHSFQWGADSVMSVKFNPIDTDVLLSSASDRNMVLYDTRTKTPIRKVVMQHLTNAIAWNPMESFNFVAANEDTNLYTFDMRNLEKAVTVHKDHVSAVLDVDFSPTGLWAADGVHSRDCYHTKRMQRIFCVQYSQDNRYILSGSDDTNIRMWKARSTERLGTLLPRQMAADNYKEKLKERYSNAPGVRSIKNQKILPKSIKKAQHIRKIQDNSKKRKIENIIRHTGKAPEEAKPTKVAKIVKVVK